MSVKEIQEMLTYCDIINFKEDSSVNNKMAYEEIQVTRENFQELTTEPKKNHTNPVKDNSLKLRKLIKKPIGMNGN